MRIELNFGKKFGGQIELLIENSDLITEEYYLRRLIESVCKRLQCEDSIKQS